MFWTRAVVANTIAGDTTRHSDDPCDERVEKSRLKRVRFNENGLCAHWRFYNQYRRRGKIFEIREKLLLRTSWFTRTVNVIDEHKNQTLYVKLRVRYYDVLGIKLYIYIYVCVSVSVYVCVCTINNNKLCMEVDRKYPNPKRARTVGVMCPKGLAGNGHGRPSGTLEAHVWNAVYNV